MRPLVQQVSAVALTALLAACTDSPVSQVPGDPPSGTQPLWSVGNGTIRVHDLGAEWIGAVPTVDFPDAGKTALHLPRNGTERAVLTVDASSGQGAIATRIEDLTGGEWGTNILVVGAFLDASGHVVDSGEDAWFVARILYPREDDITYIHGHVGGQLTTGQLLFSIGDPAWASSMMMQNSPSYTPQNAAYASSDFLLVMAYQAPEGAARLAVAVAWHYTGNDINITFEQGLQRLRAQTKDAAPAPLVAWGTNASLAYKVRYPNSSTTRLPSVEYGLDFSDSSTQVGTAHLDRRIDMGMQHADGRGWGETHVYLYPGIHAGTWGFEAEVDGDQWSFSSDTPYGNYTSPTSGPHMFHASLAETVSVAAWLHAEASAAAEPVLVDEYAVYSVWTNMDIEAQTGLHFPSFTWPPR